MSHHRYTTDEKADALACLELNGGDVVRTAAETGVPERTLYTWRRQFEEKNQRQQSPPPPLPKFENDLDAMKFLREQIVQELLNIARSFGAEADRSSPRQRALVLSQLLDRLMKLDAHLKPYIPVDNVWRIEYVEKLPPWVKEEDFTRPNRPVSVVPWEVAHPGEEKPVYPEWYQKHLEEYRRTHPEPTGKSQEASE